MIALDVQNTVNEWIKKYSDTFYSYVYQRVPDKMSAQDILQETFIAGWKNLSGFKMEADEKTWLFAILKNKLMDHYRMKAQLLITNNDVNHFFDDSGHWTEAAEPRYWGEVNMKMEKSEFYKVLEHCQSKLTRLQQLTFTMKYLDEYSSDIICKVLQIKPSNYWVIIHRCKIQLRECLEKNWYLK